MALLFCFLAFSFAVEAKMALYEPIDGLGFSVRAAKASPADRRDSDSAVAVSQSPAHPEPASLAIAAAVCVLLVAERIGETAAPGADAALLPVPHLSPQLSFRPPPVR